MVSNHRAKHYPSYVLILAIFMSLVALTDGAAAQAQAVPGTIRQVRKLEIDKAGLSHPAGLAFSLRANAFQVVVAPSPGQPAPANTDATKLTPFGHGAGSARLAAMLQNPINMAFDAKFQRLLLLQTPAAQLFAVGERADGNLDPTTLTRYNGRPFGVQNAQGMSVDPASGQLFILDAAGLEVVRVAPDAAGDFGNAVVSRIDLRPTGLTNPRGLAFDPTSGHLHVGSSSEQKLYELDQAGQSLTVRDLSSVRLGTLQGMVIAPTSDQTDNPSHMSLFVADQGSATTQSSGDIVELSFNRAPASGQSSFTSSLVRTVDTAAISPVSPDPSGLAYLPNSNTLLLSDGEIEETVNGITHFQGANVWELMLGGSVTRTTNISKVAPTAAPVTNEPTGVAWNPANGHYYVSDDDGQRVFDVDPGTDQQVGTADDSWTWFGTLSVGSGDPEGITIDTRNNRLFVVDGTNKEIYQYTLAGSLVGQFDVEQYGVVDPEGVEFNPDSGTLFVLSNFANPIIVETSTNGTLLRTLDTSANNALAPAGLAYGPASDGSSAKRFYIVDRGIDNNDNPNIVDGKIFEMTAPPPLDLGNVPPSVNAGPDQSINLPANAVLDGTIVDDGLPNPPGAVTTTWTQLNGPGLATFADPNAVDTIASFTIAGTYVLRLSANDGQWTSSDDITMTVTGIGNVTALDIRVGTGSDDAEEDTANIVRHASADLDMMFDASAPVTNLAVGMRFNGLAIPQGATIVNAYVQFQVDLATSASTQLTIQGESANNAATFGSNKRNISSRPRTTTAVGWSPASWLTVGAAGPDQRTPNLKAVIQEIVNRPGWASNNALALIMTGSGERVAKSYDRAPIGAGAPLLHVEYSATPAATNTPMPTNTPTATAVPPTSTPTPTNTPVSGASLSFAPSDDTRVQSNFPTTNYGTAANVRVRFAPDSTYNSYLKFKVIGLTGPVRSAKLRLYVADASTVGGSIYQVSNTYLNSSTLWVERGLTWENAPTISGTPLSSLGPVTLNTFVEFNVTAAIQGDGTYSFGITSTSANDAWYNSKEATANPPVLIIDIG